MRLSSWIMNALLTAFGAISMWQLTRLVSSVDSLNEKMAAVIIQQNYQSTALSDHESRIRTLEKRK